MGFLGEVLDYRWCVTLGGAATLLACRFLIGGQAAGRSERCTRRAEPIAPALCAVFVFGSWIDISKGLSARQFLLYLTAVKMLNRAHQIFCSDEAK